MPVRRRPLTGHCSDVITTTMPAVERPPLRSVRSFVRRRGRLTHAQKSALERLGPSYLIPFSGQFLAIEAEYPQSAPLCVEIGFGMGDALLAMAEANPQRNYLGIDVYPPGIGRLLAGIERAGLENIRVIEGDAVEVFHSGLPGDAVREVYIFFPDPWPKKRHRKRRLIQAPFLADVARALEPGGKVYVATDWRPYAEQIQAEFHVVPGFVNEGQAGGFVPRPAMRPVTKFEQKGRRLGHEVWDLCYRWQPAGP